MLCYIKQRQYSRRTQRNTSTQWQLLTQYVTVETFKTKLHFLYTGKEETDIYSPNHNRSQRHPTKKSRFALVNKSLRFQAIIILMTPYDKQFEKYFSY